MDSYLEMARSVLQSARQPLSARQILRTAMQMQLVPRDLYGRTQHKTLQARLATDILKHRSKSEFFRTGPGRFFLRALQSDDRLPERYRQEYHAPLRAAQLGRFDVVAFPRIDLAKLAAKLISPFAVAKLHELPWRFARLYSLRRDPKLVPFRFLLLLVAEDRIFLDNQRPTTEEGDLHIRSVMGIEGVVKRDDLLLFSPDSFGLMDAAARTLLEHFELPHHVRALIEDDTRWSDPLAVIDEESEGRRADLAVYMRFQCSGIAEITEAVEARASTGWLELPITLNNLERFDKWSLRLIADSNLRSAMLG
ncbi:winged helix-turn-helix domain-containing protein [uncultured Sphingosinicella sp.]|uniref:winged helix-turn-helix domain-containing protein n=1 Tax=uncultured Sphingosinicella sp. TaxID=478748 RepID=UPI0030DBF061